jgi:hypothetical protein
LRYEQQAMDEEIGIKQRQMVPILQEADVGHGR